MGVKRKITLGARGGVIGRPRKFLDGDLHFSVRASAQVHNRLKRLAEETECSLSDLTRFGLEQWIKLSLSSNRKRQRVIEAVRSEAMRRTKALLRSRR